MSARQFLYRAAINCPHEIDADMVRLSADQKLAGNALSQLADRLASAEAALCVIADAAQTYYSRYAQDEASEDAVEHTGCAEQHHQDACALRDALKPIFGNPTATQQAIPA